MSTDRAEVAWIRLAVDRIEETGRRLLREDAGGKREDGEDD